MALLSFADHLRSATKTNSKSAKYDKLKEHLMSIANTGQSSVILDDSWCDDKCLEDIKKEGVKISDKEFDRNITYVSFYW
jgi:hypothetical protein